MAVLQRFTVDSDQMASGSVEQGLQQIQNGMSHSWVPARLKDVTDYMHSVQEVPFMFFSWTLFRAVNNV